VYSCKSSYKQIETNKGTQNDPLGQTIRHA
jgi:hypothetical protein